MTTLLMNVSGGALRIALGLLLLNIFRREKVNLLQMAAAAIVFAAIWATIDLLLG